LVPAAGGPSARARRGAHGHYSGRCGGREPHDEAPPPEGEGWVCPAVHDVPQQRAGPTDHPPLFQPSWTSRKGSIRGSVRTGPLRSRRRRCGGDAEATSHPNRHERPGRELVSEGLGVRVPSPAPRLNWGQGVAGSNPVVPTVRQVLPAQRLCRPAHFDLGRLDGPHGHLYSCSGVKSIRIRVSAQAGPAVGVVVGSHPSVVG